MIDATVNRRPARLDATPGRPLLDVLREDLGLTGTRDAGCAGEGECGACAVLVDGRRVLACAATAADVAGRTVVTIEGLAADDGTLHPAQQAFLDDGAFQCGYCTAGMIVSVVAHVTEMPGIADDELLAKMDANVCRCCGYAKIAPACLKAAKMMREAAR